MIEHEDGLLLIDQHAAHERILYEQFATRFHDIATVKNMFPVIINVTADDLTFLEPHMGILHAHGIQTRTIWQKSVDCQFNTCSFDSCRYVRSGETIYKLVECRAQQTDMYQHLNDQLRALMACKAAVKAGDILSMTEMKKIITDLEHTENNLTCPHGRPTSWTLEHREIEKKFKRDYRSKGRDQEFDYSK